jgi:hypothetical protein
MEQKYDLIPRFLFKNNIRNQILIYLYWKNLILKAPGKLSCQTLIYGAT